MGRDDSVPALLLGLKRPDGSLVASLSFSWVPAAPLAWVPEQRHVAKSQRAALADLQTTSEKQSRPGPQSLGALLCQAACRLVRIVIPTHCVWDGFLCNIIVAIAN